MATTNWLEVPNANAQTATPAAPLAPPQGTAPIMAANTAVGSAPVTAGLMSAGTVSAPSANASTYSANTLNVDRKSTVQGQLDDMLTKGSPLMKTAETAAIQGMNKRGLMNSSMAVQAGQQAVISSALPVAQQDASTYFTGQQRNQDATNTASQFNAGATTDVSKFNAGQKLSAATTNANLATDASRQNVANALQAGIINREQANKLAEFNAQQKNTAAQVNANNKFEMERLNINNAMQAGIINQQQANELKKFNAQQENTLLAQKLDQNFKEALSSADAQTRVQLQTMQGQTQQQLANIEADYKTLMQTSQSLSDSYRSVVSSIAGIVVDQNMDAAGKATAINGMLGQLRVMANAVGSVNGVDLGNLLDFGVVSA